MKDFLIQHAVQNVWTNPSFDSQYIFEARRVTAPGGCKGVFSIDRRKLNLPNKTDIFHVYQIGQIDPKLLGLIHENYLWLTDRWFSASDCVNNRKVLLCFHSSRGVMLARSNAFYSVTSDRALVFCIKQDSRFDFDFNLENLFIRIYTNSFFRLTSDSAERVSVESFDITKLDDVAALQDRLEVLQTQEGYSYTFVNGQYRNELSLLDIKVSDHIELCFDSSIKKVVSFNVSDLEVFTSELDQCLKYLLHYQEQVERGIDAVNEVDIYICAQTRPGFLLGRYCPKSKKDILRQITHKDYSLKVDAFKFIADEFYPVSQVNPRDLKIVIHIKQSALNKELIFDSSRVYELYKLPADKLIQALIGVNSTLDLWKAPTLENSPYLTLMNIGYNEITYDLVLKAYGYNAVTKLLYDTPVKTKALNGWWRAELAVGLKQNSTHYGFDGNGLLIEIGYSATTVSEYFCQSDQVRLVESISSKGTDTPAVKYGQDNIPIAQGFNHRVYMCYLQEGVPDNHWRDITNTDLYKIENSVLKWQNKETDQFLMVRDDSTHLSYSFEAELVNGLLFFPIVENASRDGVSVKTQELAVPMGDLDVWLNRHCLIEGVDYIVKHPYAYVLNKKYLDLTKDKQLIHVRYTGFCDAQLQNRKSKDWGFVVNGLLSANKKYDLRDDKVLRIVCGGKTLHRDDVSFAENSNSLGVSNALNGLPYSIRDIVPALKDLDGVDLYTYRNEAVQIDKQVQDYMNEVFAQPWQGTLNSITSKYPLVSPFIARVINAVLDSEIAIDLLTAKLSDSALMKALHKYEYLLNFDPLNDELGLKNDYIRVEPHAYNQTLQVNVVQYRFIARVVKLYAGESINLNSFIAISYSN